MKILQLGKFYPIRGGVEKVMYDLMTGISSRGIDCDMMCVGETGGTSVKPVNPHAALICCRNVVKFAATMISPSLIRQLKAMCKDYDIIHVHHPDPMACLALRCSGYKGKVVLHWHSDILKQKFLLKMYRPLQDWLISRADAIVGTSPVYLEQSPYLSEVQQKTVCIPIGIRPVPFNSEAVARKKAMFPGRKIVFSLGRLIEYKGYETLIKAAGHLGEDCVVLIGGSGPLKESLQEQICRSGLEDKVRLLGFISDEELPDWYHACDLFCLSSKQKTEAFGIVQIEAMSCGKPLVATRIPGSGVSWVNRDGVTGINVGPEDDAAMAEAIERILSDKALYSTYAANARKRFEEIFTEDKMIDNCLDLYERISD